MSPHNIMHVLAILHRNSTLCPSFSLPSPPSPAALSMGQASSTAGRSYKAVTAAAKAASDGLMASQAAGAVAVDAQRAAQAKRQVVTLEEEEKLESKDQSMGLLLDKLGAAIHGRHINVMPNKEDLPVTPSRTSSKGRLPPHALAELLALQKEAAGGTIDASHLILKYQLDPALISKVLRVVCAPDLLQAQGSSGVQAFAGYPDWFQRRG